ncbi:MAG: putative bifunctional diguanylate cyclase/phosphodiesterase [Casimicrobium sp.]
MAQRPFDKVFHIKSADEASFDDSYSFLGDDDITLAAYGAVERTAPAATLNDLTRSFDQDFTTAFWHDVLDRSSTMTFLLDEVGVIAFESAQHSRITGKPRDSTVGQSIFDVFVIRKDHNVRLAMARMGQGQLARLSFDFELTLENGERRIFMGTAVNALTDPTIRAMIFSAHDVTERKTLENRLRHNANHDALTGLSNRRAVMRSLTVWLEENPSTEATPAVLVFDLDGFKNVNDAYGHAIGDAVLIEIANRLRQIAPDKLGIARLGGDEFVVYARFVDVQNDAPRIAQRVLDEIRKPIIADGHWIYSNASIGIASYPSGGQTGDDLIRSADTALHQAKDAGRGAIRWFSPKEALRQREQLLLRSELMNALPNHELRVFFQPIVAVNTGIVHSYETLLRWQHPTRGLLTAAQFIEGVDGAGLTDAVTQWVLHEAFAQARKSLVLSSRPLALNVSPRSLRRSDFASRLQTSLTAAAIWPNQIELEITEEDFVRAVDEAPSNIAALSDLGIRIIIDDFGKGFSNFGYLTRFPAYAIKIDREYVSQIGQNERTETLVGALVGLAEELGIQAIGEGVETQEQCEFLLHHGCVLQQGYLHGRPSPALQANEETTSSVMRELFGAPKL